MAYITRNANLILLFCIVLSLTFMVGTTIFYQNNLQRINTNYADKIGELKQVEKELNTKIKILDQVKKDLKLKSEREETFTEKYTEIRGEKEGLESERNTLLSEKESLHAQVDDAEAAKKQAEASAEYERKQNEILTAKLNDAEELADDYRRSKDQCEADLAACQAP